MATCLTSSASIVTGELPGGYPLAGSDAEDRLDRLVKHPALDDPEAILVRVRLAQLRARTMRHASWRKNLCSRCGSGAAGTRPGGRPGR